MVKIVFKILKEFMEVSKLLELEHISKEYKNKKALKDVNLIFENGIYGLLGPNGAGKSTLMNIITGNLSPTEGNVKWNKEDIKKLGASYRSLLGFAPQQQGMYDSFSGTRFLSYMATLKGIPKKELNNEIKRVLNYVNMMEVKDQKIGTYSGGMKQRILIVVLDEPTAGLDPKERVRIRERISTLSKEKIILVSTHVVSDIESVANKIILIKKGKIIDTDSVEALCEKNNVSSLEEVYMKLFGDE